MACPCCPGDDEEEEEEQDATFEKVAGPVIQRKCTDILWLALFFLYCAAFLVFYYWVYNHSNTARLFHGADHDGNICGLKGKESKGKVFFPRLHKDMSTDPSLQTRYGICVESCPKQGDTVEEPAIGKRWFVPLPQLQIANRCIPYARAYKRNGTRMCAYPHCNVTFPITEEPTKPQEVCGNKLDGTDKFWPMEEPDRWLEMGWKEEGVPANVVKKRLEILKGDEVAKADDECEVVVQRDMAFKMGHKDEGVTYELLTRFTGALFRQSQQLYSHLPLILTLGLAGSLVLSMVLIMVFPCCMKGMLVTLITLLFTVLIAVDYVLFVQAEMIEGRIGQYLAGALGKTGLSDILEGGLEVVGFNADMGRLATLMAKAEGTENQLKSTYRWLAIALAIVIVVLLCLLVAIRNNFALLFGLYSAAARTLREMPSLVLLPFVTLASLAVWTSALLHTVLGALTIGDEVVIRWLDKLGFDKDEPDHLDQAKQWTAWLLLFSFLWVYFYHVAIFQITLALGISKWYFYRKDGSESAGTGTQSAGWFFGRPLLYAFWSTMRYHLGSAAAGSFILALFTLPRVILEYVDQEIKRSQADNPLTRTLIPCMRCCLACFDRFLKALTEYAYINVAISGKGFCRSAHASIKLLVNHPVQVALDRVASASLQTLACLLVPFCLVAITYCIVKSWLIVGFFVFLLAFMVTRMCIGVFDVCISTLMVCAMVDKDCYGGRYAPSEIRSAMGLPRRTTVHNSTEGGIEMSFTPSEEQSTPAQEQ